MEETVDSKAPSLRERRWVGRLVRWIWLRDRRGRDWPVPDWLRHETVRLAGNTGADLAARWFPAPHARGTVVLAHPDRRYAQHWFIITGWVDLLHDQGYNVLTFDFPCYGASRGGSTYFFEDVIAAAQYARTRTPELPVHLIGLSQGAFHVANASPYLSFVESLVLESPYPSIQSWYGHGPGRWTALLFERFFPRSARLIHAGRNLAKAQARRILVVAPADDTVTPAWLSKTVAMAGPADRTRFVQISGADHLEPFEKSSEYRQTVLATLEGRAPVVAGALRQHPGGPTVSAHLGRPSLTTPGPSV